MCFRFKKITFIICSILLPIGVFALNCDTNSLALGCIANRLGSGADTLLRLLLGLAFVSGWGFMIAAIFKFKQVKENPTQVPVSTPFAFLLTAVLLIFIPGLLTTGAVTVFGSDPGTQDLANNAKAESIQLVTEAPSISTPTNFSQSIFGMASRLTQIFPNLMNIIIGSAYLAGLGFAIAAMMKLKAVKDNPQQNSIAMPLSYVAISVFLVFMTSLLRPVSETLFGSADDVQAGALGQGTSILVSGATNNQVAEPEGGISDLFTNVYSNFSSIADLIGGTSYIAGLIFLFAAMLKIKQHKDNPQQVTLATSLIFLVAGIGLVFLPSTLMEGAETLFSSSVVTGGVSSENITNNPWASNSNAE
ncbi:MAG: hypothetical protein VX737_05410 [Pseudomonadota bacterium]|nr:hypothetical protein [Pseudomonadota bacterium]